MDDYFETKGRARGHYSALGNELAQLALERGFRRSFDGPSYVLQASSGRELVGEGAYSRWERFVYGSHTAADLPHDLMRAGVEGLAQLEFKLSQSARRFSAKLRPLAGAKGASRLIVRTVAGDVAEFLVKAGAEDQVISAPLGEVAEFELLALPVAGQEPLAFFLVHPSLDAHRHGPMLKTK